MCSPAKMFLFLFMEMSPLAKDLMDALNPVSGYAGNPLYIKKSLGTVNISETGDFLPSENKY